MEEIANDDAQDARGQCSVLVAYNQRGLPIPSPRSTKSHPQA